MANTSLIVPTAFDARPTATSLVLSVIFSSRSPGSRVSVSGFTLIQRTFARLSAAARSQGSTFARWSSSVTTISEPESHVRASAREIAKVRVVMLAPKATSSASAPRKSPAARRVSRRSSSVSRLVGKAPWRLAPPRFM
jgi:hypothetical protein